MIKSAVVVLSALLALSAARVEAQSPQLGGDLFSDQREVAAMLVRYFETMCEPKPFVMRTGAKFRAYQRDLRQKLLACAGLMPLPKRVPLDVRYSPVLDHEWCTVHRVAYQLWPQVYGTGLLFMPKEFPKRPAPAVLCPHGHWQNGNAHPEVQKRCLVLAKMGYVVFSPTQNHYEDPALGVSHQTLMIWNNIRALDLLGSLREVDKTRIGVTGCSGGGLQTQMLVALDDRVKAATIVGLTCDYREIVFPGAAHCGCNHFPNIMRHTDEPELSALGLPAPVQYLTMNDWTRSFAQNNYPAIRRFYELNGRATRTDCYYEPTAHSYYKSKRERMYGWMEQWLRGRDHGGPVPEPDVKTFSVETLLNLKAQTPGDKGFSHISRLYEQQSRYVAPKIAGRKQWQAYRDRMQTALRELLGGPAKPAEAAARIVGSEQRDGLTIERVLCSSEANIVIPIVVLHSTASRGKLPVVILCDERGKQAALAETGAGSASALARKGALVVLPDVRFVGELSLRVMAGLTTSLISFKPCSPVGERVPEQFDAAWQRNAMLWGRPLPGMAATDLCAVINYIFARPDADASSVSVVARDNLAIAALFAAALDDRIGSLDVDFKGCCFEKRNLPLVPFVLRHGDVLQWSALLATRRLTLAGVPKEAGDPAWLREAFKAAGNANGLRMLD